MGQITINTPQGLATVDIEGDTITDEELERLRKLAPPPPGETFNYTVVEEKAKVEPETITGEIKDAFLRYEVGRMDDDNEKENLLSIKFGEDTVERVGPDTFIIDQAKVAPEIRRKYGLGDTGKIYFDKPGFSALDLADFGGEEGPVVAGAIGASIAASSLGWWPAMAVVGTTAMAVKAVDEGIEWLQGLNRQSAGEVAAQIAIEGPLTAFFEGTGRVFSWGLGRVFKGPGPQVSSQRIAEIKATTGKTTKQSTRIAKEQARLDYGQMVKAGARPTVFAVTGKALTGRILGMNEKIMPNQTVARSNVQFMEKVLRDLQGGSITQKEAQQLLKSEYDSIAAMFNIKMADPEKIFNVIQSNLDDIVKTELKAFEQAFIPAKGVPDQYVEGAQLAANLFRAESKAAYDLAEAQMGKGVTFDLQPIKDTIKRLKSENRFVDYKGTLFNQIDQASDFSLSDLKALKQALRLSSQSEELIAPAAQAGVGQIIKSVDEVIDSTFSTLSLNLARGYGLLRHPAGAVDETGKKIGGTFYKDPIGPAEKESLRQGLGSWKKANEFYTDGQQSINNTAVNVIIKNAKDKFYNSNVDVVKQIVEGGNPAKLRMYLEAVTPNPTAAAKISKPGAKETIDQIKSLVSNNQLDEAAKVIQLSGLRDILPTLNPWVGKLPSDDIFRTMHTKKYLEQMDSLSLLAQAGANPQLVRESIRNGLARTWIKGAYNQSNDALGRFSPARFASQFDKLGKETQNLLFGTQAASRMKSVTDDFYLVGANKENVIKAFRPLPEGFGAYPAGSLQGQIQSLKQAVNATVAESDNAFAEAIRKGTLGSVTEGSIYDSASLVTSLLKNPKNYTKLRSAVGEDQLNRIGGVKDMVMHNLIRNSMNSLDEATMQSGSWGIALQKNILKQNQNKALDTILGEDVVSQLTKIAQAGEKISDIPIKGFGGLVAATTALSIGAAFSTLSLPAMIAAGAAMVPILAMARLLRNKTVLNLMTSPRMRAREYEAAIKAGVELPSLDSLKAGGPLVYSLNRLAGMFNSELAIISGSGIRMAVNELEESGKAVAEQQQRGQPIRGRPPRRRGLPPLPAAPSIDELSRSFVPAGRRVLGSQTGQDLLRNVERDKLLGIR
jgi:hypothetical protein